MPPSLGVTSNARRQRSDAQNLGRNGLAVSPNLGTSQEAIQLIDFFCEGDALFSAPAAKFRPPKGEDYRDLPEILNPYPQLALRGSARPRGDPVLP